MPKKELLLWDSYNAPQIIRKRCSAQQTCRHFCQHEVRSHSLPLATSADQPSHGHPQRLPVRYAGCDSGFTLVVLQLLQIYASARAELSFYGWVPFPPFEDFSLVVVHRSMGRWVFAELH